MSDKLRKALENAISVIESVRESGAVDADDLLWLDRECAAAANAGYIALAARHDSPTLDVEPPHFSFEASRRFTAAELEVHEAAQGNFTIVPDSPTLDVALLRRVIATTEIIGPDGIPPHRWDLYADTTARIIAREYARLAAEAPERPAPDPCLGQRHEFDIACKACGRPGQVYVEVRTAYPEGPA